MHHHSINWYPWLTRAMKIRRPWFNPSAILLLVLLLAVLAGCASTPPAPNATPERTLASPLATAAITLPAAETPLVVTTPMAGDDCAYPSDGAAGALCATPAAATDPVSPYPAPGEPLPEADPTQSAAGALETPFAAAASTDFHDCARTPGLVGCEQGAPPVAGRLAFYDSAAQRLVGLDLTSGAGWQAPLDGPTAWLDWASGGENLLAALGSERYVVYQAGGAPGEAFTVPSGQPAPAWQGDALMKNGVVTAAGGARARLSLSPAGAWELQTRSGQQGDTTVALDSSTPDQIYMLRGWVPGKRWVLIQSAAGGGAAMMQGAALLVVDVDSGETLPVDPYTPLEVSAFAFHPTQGALLAMIISDGVPAGPDAFQTLALYDFDTGEKRFPLPEGAVVTGMAWRPDGERLAIAVPALPNDASTALRSLFPGGGIYLLNPQDDSVEQVVAAPAAAMDGWPQWSPDGAFLIYGRAITQPSGETTLQIRVHRISDGGEWVLVEGLIAPRSTAGSIPWQRFLAFGAQ